MERENHFIPEEKRSRKMLARCYEAISYLAAVNSNMRIQQMREEIYLALMNRVGLEKSKKIFENFGRLYEEEVSA